jgi:hypothetical protein
MGPGSLEAVPVEEITPQHQVAAPPYGPPDLDPGAHESFKFSGPGRIAQSTDAMNQY